MNFNPIIILWGEPNSVFTEIFLKSIRLYKNKKPIILIGSLDLFKAQIKKLKIKFNYKMINAIDINLGKILKDKINFIDINYSFKKPFEKISSKSNKYLRKCFETAIKISKNHNISGLINGPITTNNKIFGVNFTGSSFTGSFSGSLLADNGVLSSSAQIASNISGSWTPFSQSAALEIAALTGSYSSSVSTRLTALRADELSLRNVTGSYATTGSNTFVGNQIISGALEATGVFTLPDIANVSASIAAAAGGSGISSLVVDASPQLGGNLDLNSRDISGSGDININGTITTTGSAHFSGSVTASGDMFVEIVFVEDRVPIFFTGDDLVHSVRNLARYWVGNESINIENVGETQVFSGEMLMMDHILWQIHIE